MVNGRPLCIEIYAGLGGWSEGFIAEGWDCIGFDIERHVYGDQRYPGQLVLQDALTIHGSMFRDADCLVMSPPCQSYSWLAMPWSRSKSTAKNLEPAKALRKKWETEGPDNRLFDACFRIQKEAIAATGTVCYSCVGNGQINTSAGVQDCISCNGTGRHGTRYIPLIVENVRGAQEWVGRSKWNTGAFHLWGDVPALMPFRLGEVKQGAGKGDWFSKDARAAGASAVYGSKSPERKAIAAQIAKIPFALSSYIAQTFKPTAKLNRADELSYPADPSQHLAQGARLRTAAGKGEWHKYT